MFWLLIGFAMAPRLENVHPLQAGLFRLRHPSERRPGLKPEPAWRFWPRFALETVQKHAVLGGMVARLLLARWKIARDPDAAAYRDQALTPVFDEEEGDFDLLTKTTGARAAVAHARNVAKLTGAEQTP